MPYYKFELVGGERYERNLYAQEFDLRASDYTGHAVVFYKQHPATLEQLQRNHSSRPHSFKIEITEITKAEFDS